MNTFPASIDDANGWRRLKEILANALDEPTREAQLASVQKSCGDDQQLRQTAEELLGRDTHRLEEFADFVSTRLRSEEHDRTGERLGAYVVLEEIDRGGMGAVYLARRADGHFEKQVAIKVIKRGTDTDEALRRFRLEGQILARLDHPNITRLLDAGATPDGLPYFVMEYVRGTPITRYAREQKLDRRARVEIFLKVCRAVAAAHENQTIHRDIKPGNVLVREDGEPKLLDFGIAKLLAPEVNDSDRTAPRQSLLTSSYASPEQLAGEAATARSDIYSLGALLSELVTEQRPRGRPPGAVGDSALAGIIDRAMMPEPAERYPSAKDFSDDVERYLRGETQTLRAPSASWRRISPWAVTGALAAVCLLGALGSWIWRRQVETSPAPQIVRAAEPIHSLAVLPFEPLGGDEENQLLGLGMADAIIGRICTLPDVVVLPTSAVSRFKASEQDPIAAAHSLNVEAVISGTVQRAENRIRVTVQLIRVKDRRPLWAQKFDQTSTDIFTIQDSISEKVAHLIAKNLRPEDEGPLSAHHTNNPAAYRAYLAGLSLHHLRTRDALTKATEHFRDAVAADPNYALAYALMSDCYSLLYYYKYDLDAETLGQARTAAESALRLDDGLPESHLAMAMAQTNARREDLARQSLQRAIELNPNLALARQRYAWNLVAAGELQKAIPQMRRAQELDPLSSTNSTALGITLALARDFSGALYFCERAAELNPSEPFIQLNLGTVYQWNNRLPEALACFHKMIELNPDAEGDALASMAYAQVAAGHRAEGEALLPRIQELDAAGKVDPYYLTTLYGLLGEKARAFEYFGKAIDAERAPAAFVRYDPLLDPLRSDPRFAEVLRAHHRENLLTSDGD